jgi:hypothetical protein
VGGRFGGRAEEALDILLYDLFLDDSAAQAACTRKNILLINVCRLFYNQSPLLRPFMR